MAFRPDRSKLTRSPVTPKKSPCQVISRQDSGCTRKCSSPIFTGSPSRPAVRPIFRGLPKTPDHHKENGHSTKPSSEASGKYSKILKPGVPSPRKILGEHNECKPNQHETSYLGSKRSRKEWQIPSPSAIELKESLSVTEVSESIIEQSPSFSVKSELLSEPEPVVKWVQQRSNNPVQDELVSKVHHTVEVEDISSGSKLKGVSFKSKNLFGSFEKEDISTSPVLKEVAKPTVTSAKSENLSEKEKPLDIAEIVGNDDKSSESPEYIPENAVAAHSPLSQHSCSGSSSIDTIQPPEHSCSQSSSIDTVTICEEEEQSSKLCRGSHRTNFGKLFRLLLLGSLICVLSLTIIMHKPGLTEISRTSPSSEIEDTVMLYVDPVRLKLQLTELYATYSELYSVKFTTYKGHLEAFGLRTINFLSSYYSSLVLENHAKDILFNYHEKFQGQYYRLRFALVSLIQRLLPMETAVRDMIMKVNLPEKFCQLEHFVNEALVHNYLNVLKDTDFGTDVNDVSEECKDQVDIIQKEENIHSPIELNKPLEETKDEVDIIRAEIEEVSDETKDQADNNTKEEEDMNFETDVDEILEEEIKNHIESSEHLDIVSSAPPAEDNIPQDRSYEVKWAMYLVAGLVGLSTVSIGFVKVYLGVSQTKMTVDNSRELLRQSLACEALSTPEIMRMRGAGEELVLTPEQQAAGCSPYGSFTAYKRIVFNEGTENEHIQLTPVRRSNRIRNQVFSSPRP